MAPGVKFTSNLFQNKERTPHKYNNKQKIKLDVFVLDNMFTVRLTCDPNSRIIQSSNVYKNIAEIIKLLIRT